MGLEYIQWVFCIQLTKPPALGIASLPFHLRHLKVP
jgi:hypothetical protein